MQDFTFSRWQILPVEPLNHCSQIHTRGMKYTNNKNNVQEILKVYIINSITKSYILNIKIRPLVTEYALMIRLVSGTTRLILMRTSDLVVFKIYDLYLNEMMMMSTMYQTNTLSLIFNSASSLEQQSAGRMSLYSDTLS